MRAVLTVATLPAERHEAAALALEARSPNTRRAYRAALARLDRFLSGRALTDATLAAHVRALAAAGMAPASASQAAAAAAFFARVAGWPSPRGPMTADALRIARRDHADRGRGRARALTADQIAEIVATARQDGRMIDAAIAGVLFQAALRRSEAAALEWRDIEPATDLPGAFRIRVRAKKTDQAGEETDIRIVKNAVADALAAGIEGVTAHSGRIAHASELTARGASTTEVMLSGGWKTARMVAHYAAGVKAERGAVAKYL